MSRACPRCSPGLPTGVPGSTINRLCGSGMDAVGSAARAIRAGDGEFISAGGVESMTRAPFVMGKATSAFSRSAEIFDTTIGWRFVNKLMKAQYGVDSMPETAENVAVDFEREPRGTRTRSRCAASSAPRARRRTARSRRKSCPCTCRSGRATRSSSSKDEHPRETSMEALAKLKGVVRPDGSVTAGNASGVNDGACALILASEAAARRHGLRLRARVLGMASAGVEPRIMGIGPAPATQRLLARLGLTLDQIDVIELNEAFASQGIAVLRQLGLAEDDPRVNPNGGAIALGHPLGARRARGSSRPRSTSSNAPTGASRCARCASAWARASPSPSSAFEGAPHMSAGLHESQHVGIVGAGAMGAGIAQVAVLAGHRVVLYDLSARAVDQALASIAAALDKLVAKRPPAAHASRVRDQAASRPRAVWRT